MAGLLDYQRLAVIVGCQILGELSLAHQMGDMLTGIEIGI